MEGICGDARQDIGFSENMEYHQSNGRKGDNTKHKRSPRSGREMLYYGRGEGKAILQNLQGLLSHSNKKGRQNVKKDQ